MTGYWDNQIGTWLPDDPKRYCPKCEKEVEFESELNEVKDYEDGVCDECFEDYQMCTECGLFIHQDEFSENGEVCGDCFIETLHLDEIPETNLI